MLNLDALRVLDAIERRGSFSAAADSLHRVPSAITYTVRKLEQEMGVTLFDRSGHKTRLTEAGRVLLEEGRRLIASAQAAEARVRRVASGWEAELNIVVDHLLVAEALLPMIARFYQSNDCDTHLRVRREVFGGTWDALVSGRADLAVGASGDGPPGGGYILRSLGNVPLTFAVSPGHPLAELPEPLSREQVAAHRAIAVADTSRTLLPRTAGLYPEQSVLIVPDLAAKRAAQLNGLGVGRLPTHMIGDDLMAGRLVAKEVAEFPGAVGVSVAWRSPGSGQALRWLVAALEAEDVKHALLGVAGPVWPQ